MPETKTETRYVYEFSEGSREMRETARRQGRQHRRDDQGPRRRPGSRRLHDHDRRLRRLHGVRGRGRSPASTRRWTRPWRPSSSAPGSGWAIAPDPLLVSVRSGARDSMPGMLETVLNLGLGDDAVEGLAERTSNPRFAWDSYRRFVQMFGDVVHGIPSERFESALRRAREEKGVEEDTGLDADDLRELTATFKAIFSEVAGEEFPTEPRDQLRQAIVSVFDSWNGDRAVTYRRLNSIPDDWGTAVNVQQMVFGNKGNHLGLGCRLQPRRAHRRAGALRRLPARRPGRGRRRRDPQSRGPLGAGRADARGACRAAGDPPPARAPLPRHAGRRVHDRGGAPLPAADPQREAPGAGGGALRPRRGRGGAARRLRGAADDRRRLAGGAPPPGLRPRVRIRAADPAGSRPRPAPPRAGSPSAPRRRFATRRTGRT